MDSLTDACTVALDSLRNGELLETERYEEVLGKVVEEEREVSQGAAILKNLKGLGVSINTGLEQSLTRIMVDNALEEPRAFGTQITNWSDTKYHKTPND